jgi:hypothetical protein
MEHWSTAVMAIRAEELFFSFNPSLHDSLAQTWFAGPEFSRYRFQNIAPIAAYSDQVAPGRANWGEALSSHFLY